MDSWQFRLCAMVVADSSFAPLVYLVNIKGALMIMEISIMNSLLCYTDLNKDGYPDVVFTGFNKVLCRRL
jgi:hypothetical protein